MQWERCELDAMTHSKRRKGLIWLQKTSNDRYGRLNISSDIREQAGLKVGDSIWLYKSGTTFLIKKEPSDFYLTVRTRDEAKDSGIIGLSNMNFIGQILAAFVDKPKPPKYFDAIVTDEGIMFEARKE